MGRRHSKKWHALSLVHFAADKRGGRWNAQRFCAHTSCKCLDMTVAWRGVRESFMKLTLLQLQVQTNSHRDEVPSASQHCRRLSAGYGSFSLFLQIPRSFGFKGKIHFCRKAGRPFYVHKIATGTTMFGGILNHRTKPCNPRYKSCSPLRNRVIP